MRSGRCSVRELVQGISLEWGENSRVVREDVRIPCMLVKIAAVNGPKTLEVVDTDFGSAEADDGAVGLVCGVDGAVLDVAEADPEDPEVGVKR